MGELPNSPDWTCTSKLYSFHGIQEIQNFSLNNRSRKIFREKRVQILLEALCYLEALLRALRALELVHSPTLSHNGLHTRPSLSSNDAASLGPEDQAA